ncbi:MAG: AbrB/MazE/SpoVT family DNA-binding domain-containing protein [Clostridia bacterium]|nr:AbrB/MazE/SpoVT family DNA-binding domain-containing protein [Clostridia bacterium]
MRVGIRRNIDNLGRITIPVSFRRSYGLEKGQEVAIADTDEGVLIFNPNKKKEKDNCK